jgi:GTP-binding protein
MASKPMIVALNKVDLVEARDNLTRLHEVLEGEGHRVLDISAATGEGVSDLLNEVGAILRELELIESEQRKSLSDKPKRRVYTIGNVDERAWEVNRVGEDSFRVIGVGIERFTHMTNFDLWEAAERFQRVLDRSGITAELNRQGVKQGDVVMIANHEMVWGEQEDEDGSFIITDDGEEDDVISFNVDDEPQDDE